jgi:hypothetical protein
MNRIADDAYAKLNPIERSQYAEVFRADVLKAVKELSKKLRTVY